MSKFYSNQWLLTWSILLMIIMILIQTSCHHKPVIPDSPAISFKKQIQPLFANNCALSGCHDGVNQVNLYFYSNIIQRVSPGDAHNSKIYNKITTLSSDRMPPTGPLSEAQVKLIYAWIMQGAKDN